VAANNPDFVVAYFAILGCGAVAVPLNPTSPSSELAAQLDAAGARAVVVGPTGRAAMSNVTPGSIPSLEHVLVTEGVEIEGARALARLVDLAAGDGGASLEIVDREPSDVAALLFTAGTSGSPKAAMLTHGNLLANLDQLQSHPGHGMTAGDVVLGVLPMFHIFGLNVMLGLTIKSGASVVLIERFDPASSLDSIRDRGVTIVAGAPPMYAAWLGLPGATPEAFASVRQAVSGAAALPAEVAAQFAERFAITIHEGYGLTEAAPTVTSSVGGARPGSIGVPLPGVEVRLVDEDGRDVLAGDAGEVWVRGPNVFPGYWNDAEATALALTEDGWLRTGDIATVDDDGYLYLVDRAKDLVIVSGFNVYPAEVEGVLAEHPGVADVAVVGVAHPHSGEAVKAFVVAAGRQVDEDDLIEFCAARLARYKCPTKITFVDELPKGLGGKLLRRALQ
jgi:long-chain acyl-CoA synthetase